MAICKTLFYSFILPQLKTFPSSSSTPGQQYHPCPSRSTPIISLVLFSKIIFQTPLTLCWYLYFHHFRTSKTRLAVWPYVRLVLSLVCFYVSLTLPLVALYLLKTLRGQKPFLVQILRPVTLLPVPIPSPQPRHLIDHAPLRMFLRRFNIIMDCALLTKNLRGQNPTDAFKSTKTFCVNQFFTYV